MLFASKVPADVPLPPAVFPVPPPVPESAGGGGTTLGNPTTGAVDEASERVPVPPETPVVGGGAMHLNDALADCDRLEFVCNLHEQASAIAAENYAKATNSLGVALVTTGPGGTNAITGVWGARPRGHVHRGQAIGQAKITRDGARSASRSRASGRRAGPRRR